MFHWGPKIYIYCQIKIFFCSYEANYISRGTLYLTLCCKYCQFWDVCSGCRIRRENFELCRVDKCQGSEINCLFTPAVNYSGKFLVVFSCSRLFIEIPTIVGINWLIPLRGGTVGIRKYDAYILRPIKRRFFMFYVFTSPKNRFENIYIFFYLPIFNPLDKKTIYR